MSLVVTSNIANENDPDFSNAFKPYSYQNRLLNTMKIPANSEIALQSAKINKNGLFVLDRANSGFCHYFGTRIGSDADIPDLSYSTTQPFRAVIGAGESFRAGEKSERNVEDMANDLQKGLNQATFHPSLINGTSTTTNIVQTENASDTTAFQGFRFTATQQTAKSHLNQADVVWTDINKNNAYGFSQAAGVATAVDNDGFILQSRQYPISQNNGHVTFDISGCNVSSNNNAWSVGLSRINQQRDIGEGNFDYTPTYFDNTFTGARRTGIYRSSQWWYGDILLSKVGDNLRLWQSGARTGGGTGQGIFMNEIIYYGAHNTNFPAVYDISTNSSGYNEIKIVLSNEELKVYLVNGGTETLLCDYTTLRAAGAVKNQCLNPVNAAKWAMYPVVAIGSNGSGKTISVDNMTHYSNYPEYNDATYFNYDWWGWSQTYNELAYCKELEMRDWNNFSRTTTGTLGNGLLAPKGVNASGGMDGYESIIITAKSVEYGNATNDCNTGNTLGFIGVPVSEPTSLTNLVCTTISTTIPKLNSNISLFIRLNNFTQNTMNARQGTLSKIVAHLPRFDNSGNEIGGLYFEPHEKTYLALNNTEDLYVNSFDVDLVYENETLCTALTGKTIVCFHIRQAK